MMKRCLILVGGVFLYLFSGYFVFADKPTFAEKETVNKKCVGCHSSLHQGLVTQHLESPMANLHDKINPILCLDCHGFEHQSAEDYTKAEMPTAETCGECHHDQLKQLREGKHNLAWFGMKSQVAYHRQQSAIVEVGYRGCSGCHKIGQKGLMGISQGITDDLEYDAGQEMSKYRYGNTQCDACHTRHSFKKSEAQDPRVCSNCHVGFDHPQWEMYMSSKHGIVWDIEKNKNVKGRTPTCQYCHMPAGNHTVKTSWGFLALRIPTKSNVLKLIGKESTPKDSPSEKTSWGELAQQISDESNVFKLIENIPELVDALTKLVEYLPVGNYEGVDDDPQWVFDRALILQASGILDANFQPTKRFIEIVVQGEAARGPTEFNEIRGKMKTICQECHAKKFVELHFKASDEIIKAADREFAKAIQAVQGLYQDGILEKPANWEFAPDLLQFYDAKTVIEQELYLILLEYRQRTFQGAFHASNDYMHWYGWAPLKTAVANILEEAKRMRTKHEEKGK
ncbi:multiheme c-type cytochrome [Candidatus Parabeggiatoa sp. HSG14]|uniref:multiheme c-type cytochrome n=1 Tax=Candidatus Parabeggiatoa sp. HSG14 TaxID=3055593 RepID=UPI0025A70D58|nr:multiheme c-type cytochrome [Thiotrichales bacterium HSG14]